MTKYVKLFEDYSKESDNTSDSGSDWTTVRDAVQLRLPFVIIVFKGKNSYGEAIKSDMLEANYIKQTALMSKDGKLIKYPSVFMVVQDDESFKNKIPRLFDSFNIKALVIGKKAEEEIEYYYADGSRVAAGNEIVSSLSKDEMQNEDHFEVGSTNYKFIDFVD